MTRDHRRKKAVRAYASATGRSFADAATARRTSQPGTAVRLRDDLAAALDMAGWPVQIDPSQSRPPSALLMFAGPASIGVGRHARPTAGLTGTAHPDDPKLVDLASPLQLSVSVPVITALSAAPGADAGTGAREISGAQPVGEIVAEIDRVASLSRRRDLTNISNDVECNVCDDSFPAGGLFECAEGAVLESAPVKVCPSCAFDGDLIDPLPARLALQIDRASFETVTAPAGWAGVQALLSILGGPDFRDWLADAWPANGNRMEPQSSWDDPLQTWVWLPPVERRPAALASLGCGSSLGRIVSALDHAHPGLRTACQDRILQEENDDLDRDVGVDIETDQEEMAEQQPTRVWQATFDRIWPANVAYAVGMLTQQIERNRNPWHFLDAFVIGPWLDALGSNLDEYDVEHILNACIPTIRDILDSGAADLEE